MNVITNFCYWFRRYLAGIHYFYIFEKQRSKWNSGKINYNYLLNKFVVSHTSVMYSHGIYVCITIWCVQIAMYKFTDFLPIERFMRCNIYRLLIGSEIQFGQLIFNCISSGFTKCHCLCHMACVKFTLVALVCSHCTCLMGVDVRKPDCHKDGYCRERGLHLWGTVCSRSIATQRRCLVLQLRPGHCWFIIELIICYILHRYLILSSLSQVLCIIWRASRKSTRTDPEGWNKEQCCNQFQTPNHGT